MNSDDLQSFKESWNAHPQTKILLSEYRKHRRNALIQLLASCENSVDPKIKGHYESIKRLDEFIIILGGKKLVEEVGNGKEIG